MATALHESAPSMDAVFMPEHVRASHRTHRGSVYTLVLYSGGKAQSARSDIAERTIPDSVSHSGAADHMRWMGCKDRLLYTHVGGMGLASG